MDVLEPVIEPGVGGVSTETPNPESVPQGGTPLQGATDVEKSILEVRQKAERDIAALKSSFQRSEFELKQTLENQKKAYEEHIRELKLSKMDEVERKKYEDQELIERNKNYQAEALLAQQKLAERDQKDQYRDYFMSLGLPSSELVMDQDFNALYTSGMAAWAKMTNSLKAKVEALEKAKTAETDGEVTPPDVDTSKGKPPKGRTWADLIKTYGSEEKVYRLVELGELPSSILPV